MLGIIIGVMSVVVLISIVNGTTSSVTSQIEDMGSNLLTVNVRDTRYGSISMSDLTEIEDEYDTIAHTAPVITSTQTAKAGNEYLFGHHNGDDAVHAVHQGNGAGVGEISQNT